MKTRLTERCSARCVSGLDAWVDRIFFCVVVVFVQTSAQKRRLHAVLHHRHCPQVSGRRSVSAARISVDSLSFSLFHCLSLSVSLPFSLSSPFSLPSHSLPLFLAPPAPSPSLLSLSPSLSLLLCLSYFCRLSLTLSLLHSLTPCVSFCLSPILSF